MTLNRASSFFEYSTYGKFRLRGVEILIKAILFDLDDTVIWDKKSVQEAFSATCLLAKQRYGIEPLALENAVRREALRLYSSYPSYPFTKQIGINPIEALWATFNEGNHDCFRFLEKMAPTYRRQSWTNALHELGVNDSQFGEQLAEIFQTERRNRPILFHDSISVLNSLIGNYKLMLLTNGAPDLQKEKMAGFPGLADYFDEIVISGDFGAGKPDRAIFEHSLKLLSVKKEEAIMIGDNLLTDILGANRIGMKSIWVNRKKVERDEAIEPDFEIGDLSEMITILS
jgi:putative hydrolase of the HAD superfamily